jgi:hypothetical protein
MDTEMARISSPWSQHDQMGNKIEMLGIYSSKEEVVLLLLLLLLLLCS